MTALADCLQWPVEDVHRGSLVLLLHRKVEVAFQLEEKAERHGAGHLIK